MKTEQTNDYPEIEWETSELLERDPEERMKIYLASGESADGRKWNAEAYYICDEFEEIKNIEEVSTTRKLKNDPFIAKHLSHIKLLTAKYSGKKIFIECYPTDEGAQCFPNSNRAVKEINPEALDLYMKLEANKAGAVSQEHYDELKLNYERLNERERELVEALQEVSDAYEKPTSETRFKVALYKAKQVLSNHKK